MNMYVSCVSSGEVDRTQVIV